MMDTPGDHSGTAHAPTPTILTDHEREKVRDLFLACTSDSCQLASSLLDSLQPTARDLELIFDRAMLAAALQTWDAAIWDAIVRKLPDGSREHVMFQVLLLLQFIGAGDSERQKGRFRKAWSGIPTWCWVKSAKTCWERLRQHAAMPDGQYFSQHSPLERGWVNLGFLTDLPQELLPKIGDFNGDLHLNGLTSLTVSEAAVLGGHKGWLYLNGISEVTDDVAAQLASHQSDVYLDGLTTLTHAGLAAKLASRPWLFLDHVVHVSGGVDAVLAGYGGRLSMRSMPDLIPTSRNAKS
jgi:hypothetical protein